MKCRMRLCKDGILTVHIPKTAESPKHKVKQITVQ
jgi:HSP20 family molecular chaperone IbpA